MNNYALLTVTGRDRPGMVARTTQVLYETGCNIADSSMTRLGGEFTVMLILQLPLSLTPAALSERFQQLSTQMELLIQVQPLPAQNALIAAQADSLQSATLSLLGADQPGIVYRVTQFLADQQCNIVDLYTRVLGPTQQPIYSMVIEVEAPAHIDLQQQLQPGLSQLEALLHVEIHLRLADSSLM
ncbi:glycine cleavage system protein R [Candidatus Magnetaquicoccus inordinatus]|uniref:glycine cleavage system protein R n=1 Tax=Candidatus Magnetaquicoccus inordinatus TaxID=2496818 RepID=UPI00102CF4CD|nr:ACT domain-containing protein [Candidatus Magnetaquicoccus inordinatus]